MNYETEIKPFIDAKEKRGKGEFSGRCRSIVAEAVGAVPSVSFSVFPEDALTTMYRFVRRFLRSTARCRRGVLVQCMCGSLHAPILSTLD